MATIYKVNDGDTIELTAGTASDINAGDVVIEGGTATNITAIAPYFIAKGTTGVGNVKGCYTFACASATTFSVGDKVYYNKTSKLATATNTDYLVGMAFGKTVAGDEAVLVGLNVKA